MKLKVEEYYDKMAKLYDELYNTPYWRLYEEVEWQILRKHISPLGKGAKVLDAGGGTGRLTVPLAKMGYYVILLDTSVCMLNVALEKIKNEDLDVHVDVLKGDIRYLDMFNDETFDLVLALGDPLSYCTDYERALKELSRVTKLKGKVIISVDNRLSIIRRILERASPEESIENILRRMNKALKILEKGDFEREYPIHAFTPDELRSLFEKCGLRIVEIAGLLSFIDLLPPSIRDKVIEERKEDILKIVLKEYKNETLLWSAGHILVVGVKE